MEEKLPLVPGREEKKANILKYTQSILSTESSSVREKNSSEPYLMLEQNNSPALASCRKEKNGLDILLKVSAH